MENRITITLEEYKSLLLMAAKTEVIKKMVESNKYVSTAEIKIILDIEESEDKDFGQV